MIILKNEKQIDTMDEANKIVHDVLDQIVPRIVAGTTTEELDEVASKVVGGLGAKATFKGYAGYPKHLCVSVNDEIVHGIPGSRVIQNGDVVSIDFGATYKGFVGDAARTVIVGEVSEHVRSLVEDTRQALLYGIEQMVPDNHIFDVSRAIEEVALENNYGNVRNFCGHGIGKNMHEDPKIFNYVDFNQVNFKLREGMVFALEPMFTLGTSDTEILEDKWTVVTTDGSPAVHWELSVAITKDGPRVLGYKL